MKKLFLLLAILLLVACSAAAEDVFLPEGEVHFTDTTYRSHDIAIDITSRRVGDSDVFIADIRLRSTEVMHRIFAGGEWNTIVQHPSVMAQESGAVLSITGDSGQCFGAGLIVGDGKLVRDLYNDHRDVCVIRYDGVLDNYIVPVDYQDIGLDTVWQAFTFGPVLLDEEGHAMRTFHTEVGEQNPRSVIGYYEPLHYCFVLIDGRSTPSKLEAGRTNLGLDMQNTANLMEDLGCTRAYNLDGGKSSVLWFNGKVINSPQDGGREIGDILILREVD